MPRSTSSAPHRYFPRPGERVHDDSLVASTFAPYCALRAMGDVWCWGSNGCDTIDEVGLGTQPPLMENECSFEVIESPALVPLSAPATRITTGARHACALLESGEVYCWGGNNRGQLGDGTGIDSTIPVRVRGLP